LPSLIFMIPAVKESYSERYDALTVTGFAVIDGVEAYANKGAGLAFDVLKSSFMFLRSFSPTGFAITTGLGNGSSSNYKLTFASIGSIGDSGSSSSYNVNVSGDAAWGTVMGNGSSSGYIIQLGYLKQPLNTAPTIIDISDVPAVTLSEGLVTPVEFSFVLDDQDGISDLVNESVEANFSKEGDTTRWNTTCLAVVEGTNATAQNYTCTIDMQYWDGDGTWTADVQGGDEEFNVSKQETFTVNTLTAVNISATTLSWAQLFVGSIDNMMSTAELNITNIGNQNLTNITLQGINLIGETTNTVWIPAANFTSSWGVRGCDAGAWLINDTDMQINSDSALDFGPGNLVTTNNATHVCMEEIGQDITQQSYSTAGDVEDWTITGGTGAI
ncbi:MAG: hypothetical protein Q8N77_02430, partial [Nanoarchaeota archaeon]|nr:hypothetical protein [Nanoarchaeota archaeon]